MTKRRVVKLKRAYDPPDPDDGYRILVDRLWPRGVAKASARIDLWLQEIAPSAALRKWFDHDPSRWPDFRTRYFQELDKNHETLEKLVDPLHRGPVTLVYGAKDQEHNNAVALQEYLSTHPLT